MPYIITTTTLGLRIGPETSERQPETITSRAVATLEEARKAIVRQTGRSRDVIFSESGGTVGPLPDGTMIKVERVTTEQLADVAQTASYRPLATIIDAYNAAQS